MRRTGLLVASVALAVLLACGVAFAAAGDLDPSFGGDGRVITEFTGSAQTKDLIVQPDGKLVAAGYRLVGSDLFFALTRYNPNGSLDKGFGTNGRVVTGPDYRYARALARQRDGKLVVAGFGYRTDVSEFVVTRYNPSGSLDRSFGDGGTVTTGFSGDARPEDLVVQPDGKLIVAGDADKDPDDVGPTDSVLVRYNPNGSLDEGFGEGGKVISDFYSDEGINSLVVLPNGRLVAAGYAFVGGGGYNEFSLTRYNRDGSLDRSFGRGGKVTTSMGSRYDIAKELILQPDGRLVAGGECCGGNGGGANSFNFVLVRYKPDGSLDGTFGRAGKVITDFLNNEDRLDGLILQPDGKLVAAGSAEYGRNAPIPYDDDFALARYHQSGALDGTFGVGGKLTTGFPGTEDYASALVRQPDGKLVAAGYSDNSRQGSNGDGYAFALARYLR